MAIFYSERLPAPDVGDFVDCYWDFHATDAEPFEHIVPPDGSVTISGSSPVGGEMLVVVVGPSTFAQTVWVQPGWRYAGARLLPGAAGSLLKVNPGDLRGQVVPSTMLGNETGGWCDELACALLEDADPEAPDRVVRDRINARPDPLVAAAVGAIRQAEGACSIMELASAHGLGERQFRRRFQSATGLSPKEYARLAQLRSACILAVTSTDMNWSAVSARAGYADQPHLVRAVSRSFRLTPTQVGAYLRQITHSFATGTDVRNVQDRVPLPR